MLSRHRAQHRRHVDLVSTVVLVVALVVAGFVAWTTRPWERDDSNADSLGLVGGSPAAPRPGAPAPDFVLQRADGTRVQLSDLRGTPVFLNFWATWCTFCKEEMPDMQRIAEEYDGRIIVLGVNVGESAATGSAFADRNGITYDLVYDADQEVTRGYAIRAMPTSYFIDANGTVVDAQFGFMTFTTMQEKVVKLLEESG